jgi:dipeptidyl aminopeptidase/acylaminoacyl peptidase
MRVWRRAALYLGLVAAWGLAQPGPAPHAQSRRSMTLVDLMNMPRVGDPQITRDGRHVTFTLATTDWPNNRRVPQIWQIRSDGSGLRRLTSTETGAGNARWSPDGSTIAFLGRGKEPGLSIFLMPADGGTARQLSHHPTGVSDIAWHPDGASIYFLANDSPTEAERERERLRGDIQVLDEFRFRHLWKIAVADGKETRVTGGEYSVFAFKIAASGQRIIISRRPTSLAADIEKIELWSIGPHRQASDDGPGAVQLTRNKVPEEDGELAPDGSQVLFVARANARLEPYYNANLFLVPASGGAARAVMPNFPYEVLRAGWAIDSRSIWMVVNMGVHSELFQVDLATSTPRQITNGAYSIVHEQWSTAGDRHVFLIDQPTRIGDVWTLAPGASAPTRVTGIYDYLDRDFAMPRQERIEWKGADGVRVEGILTYPVQYKPGTRYPLVVQMHGGPEASDRFGFGTVFLSYHPAWAAKGYAVLRPNYRGSSGYGNAFYREPIGGYFKNSHLDVLAGVDRVIAMGVADPDRLTMMGWSAGGHLVNKLITFTNRFKAASSYAGVANWISLYGQSDTRGDRDLWLGGTLWQKNAPIQTYWDHSPLKYVSAAHTPTLFLIGEDDPRVPMAQSVEMHRALKALGVPSELHIAPDEGHTWLRPVHQLYKMNTEIAWFERYALDRGYTPEIVPQANDPAVVPPTQ